ncbi:hypothetical protein [Lyngbya aestuarii]|uniref:hypothetical protein n=1 Tax=Lyngbya aestuarii TaxID=118322 RepID=UPI00403DC94F
MTYIDADKEFVLAEGPETTPEYPTAFGVTITPKVGGIFIALLGLAGAFYLLLNVVQPSWERYRSLQADIADKKSQIQSKEEIQKQIQQKKEELAQAKQQNRQVLSLFANEKTLDTLLLDLNTFVKDRNGTLVTFQPDPEGQVIVNDGSLGPLVNGKLKRQTIDIEMEGRFEQVQSIMRSFERLQSLLLVKDFQAEVSTPQPLVINQGKVIPGAQPTIKTNFKLEALLPLTDQEEAAATAAQSTQQTK